MVPASGDGSPDLFVFEFWASSCESCDEALSRLSQLEAHVGKRVAVLGISIDENRRTFESALGERKLAVPVIWDKGQRLAAAFRLSQVPTIFVVARDGRVKAVFEGRTTLNEVGLRDAIRDL
jgi:thiol-disulfide isomerase/thioredoxin